jgi:hypothetical protein
METLKNIVLATRYVSHAFYASLNTLLSSSVTVFCNFYNIMRLHIYPNLQVNKNEGFVFDVAVTLEMIFNALCFASSEERFSKLELK